MVGSIKLLIFSSKSLEKHVVTRIFSHLVANSSFCTSGYEALTVQIHDKQDQRLRNITRSGGARKKLVL